MKLQVLSGLMFLSAAFGLGADAQQPKAVSESELDRIASDVLKEMHNKGAELYNANDSAGCLKVYSTALQSVRPFLKHRAAIQKTIDAGLLEVEKLDGAKARSFRLHEIIERVRADLKAEPALPKATQSQVSGVVTLDGQPLAGAAITLTGGNRGFTAITDAEGRYAITDAVPAGTYAVFVTGSELPAKYHSSDTSGLMVEVVAGKNTHDLNLQSK